MIFFDEIIAGKLYDARAFSSLPTLEFVANEETPTYLVFLNPGDLLLHLRRG